jgi:tRNA (adenine22-N1)-methyltransferase
MDKNKRLLRPGSRLSLLENMLVEPYRMVWDCCCDHGLLGMSLLKRSRASEVIFVDVLEEQMKKLEATLRQNYPVDEYRWHVRCGDVKNIVVPNRDSQLFIIAGVGARQTVEFINSLSLSAPHVSFDLLICSVHGNYAVRNALINNGYKLKGEQIIFENNRFYEGIYVSKGASEEIANTGSTMWDWSNSNHQQYWRRIVGHYRQKARNDPEQYQPIVANYEALLTSSCNI